MPSKVAAFILQGQSAYNSLTALNRELSRALLALEIEPIVADGTRIDEFNAVVNRALQEYGPQRIIAGFSFSAFGTDIGINTPEGSLWERLQIPIITWMVDHPAYYLARHRQPTPAIARLYSCGDFFDFQRDYVRAPYRTAYIPFGAFSHGKEAKQRMPKAGEVPLILFPKSGGNPAALEEKWRTLPVLMQRILHDAVDHYWGETPRSGNVVNSVLAAADRYGVELRNDLPLLTFFVAHVDDYTRHRKDNILFRELLPFPVQIYGRGFEHIDVAGARAKVLPPIDHAELSELYHEALAIVSMNPNLDDEAHDRVFSAFGCGALPVSEINPWWRKKYAPLLPYSYDFRDQSVAAALEKILTNPMDAAALAWQAGKQMREERPFQKAVMEVVEWALMHRFFSLNFKSPQPYYVRHGA